MQQINYKKLKEEVWDLNKCSGCGACCTVCPADALVFIKSDNSHPVNTGYCKDITDFVKCGACYNVCPRTDSNEDKKDMLGEYIEIKAAKAIMDIPGRQSGGAVTAILKNALKRGIIDAVVTVSEDRWTHMPKSVLITSDDTIEKTAGSIYNWWTPTLLALSDAVILKKCRNIAVVGTPCAVSALRLMKNSENDLVMPFGKTIRLIIGLFCTETFDYQKLMNDKIKTDLGIDSWKIKKMDIKGKLEITLGDESKITVPLSELENTIRTGCRICKDFTAVDSDISAGSVGSPEGNTTLIIRNSEGLEFFESAVNEGFLEVSNEIDITSIIKLAEKKKKTAEDKE
ncbi:Coenzyme F420 hydrogenase/dehydrogenase, beta subunit C-terminal domain [Methanomicrobium antiquum]|uniref:Coenzyme F420 hydrogenase/dehydrogenase, beta subunit C-terminal domain n=1 Tax=Methanomicrobium antiquum TaxID=487686 RepID=A0AAF0FTW2_9EURY|nr:Coenzyme F420 hydrogenase/dehydrogenase, beta subunit C-terminal domain [Methanomicrobium antiquum]WFN37851.1 Coenzyme F420 hydrogenase/dehydrogenase, beta subunit C-terminal domain [Methanomicrobium antiquum]